MLLQKRNRARQILSNVFFLACFSLTTLLVAQEAQQEQHSRLKIYTDDAGLTQLDQLGVAVDHGIHKEGAYFIAEFSASEKQKIEEAGYVFDVMISDMDYFYKNKPSTPTTPSNTMLKMDGCSPDGGGDGAPPFEQYATPSGWELGSMAGFYTYAELLQELDDMATAYPNLITAKAPIDTILTHEDRPIYWLKISDNPNQDETDEPEVLYDALIHAREPASMQQMIFYMWYLLENYEKDDEIKFLVDNTEMYFIPCINPDGYVFNETSTGGAGFGFWRKNRRDNGDGTIGVDLNRNFGYEWGLDDNGSSPETDSNVYRGPAPFSEPETRAIKSFCESHEIQIALNYHTYTDLLIYPWGFIASFETPDSMEFRAYAAEATLQNNYTYGTGDQTVGYLVNGDTDDWMYGEQTTKDKIISMTPEVGGDDDGGFWPDQENIETLAKENVWANLTIARLMHTYGKIQDNSPDYFNSTTNAVSFDVERLGKKEGSLTVSIEPVNSAIASVGAPVTVDGLAFLDSQSGSIDLVFSDDIAFGDEVVYELVLDNNEGLVTRQTITKLYGIPVEVYSNNIDDITTWGGEGDWGLTTDDYYTAPASMTDSPFGDYQNGASTSIMLSDVIDLTEVPDANLRFWAKWDIEPGYDYTQVIVHDVATGSTTALCGLYTKTGVADQVGASGEPLFDGTQATWVQELMPLSDFAGSEIQIEFVFYSDVWVNGDGFYFDDLSVEVLTEEPVGISTTTINQNWYLGQSRPNPANANSAITIDYQTEQTNGEVQLVIVNALGQTVYQESLNNAKGQVQVNLKRFAKGIYHYRLESAGQISHSRKLSVL
ncbi:MAG: M14 family zinc carboxypeptidase [Chitinophagales bacterium]